MWQTLEYDLRARVRRKYLLHPHHNIQLQKLDKEYLHRPDDRTLAAISNGKVGGQRPKKKNIGPTKNGLYCYYY